jgi:type IV pilus assembly protein PilO
VNATAPTLKPRDVFLIVLGLCVILLLAWYFLRFQARQLNIQDVQSQLDQSSTQLATLQDQQSKIPALRADVKELEARQQVFVKALPSTLKMGQVLSDLRDSVSAAGGSLEGVATAPSADLAALPSGVQATNLTINLKGKFAPMFRTVRSVETMGRFSKITNLSMTLPAPNEVDPDLNSVLNMTVYTFDPAKVQPGGATAVPGGAPAAPGAAPAAPAAAPAGGNS